MVLLNKFKIIALLLALLMFSSCQRWAANILIDRPDSEFDKYLKDTSVEFVQGWKDGCETGMSNGISNFYRMFYRNNKADGYKMTSSADYKTAWGNAFWYCYRKDWVKQKNPRIWSSVFGGYK
jgi:hypothetical protein